MANGAAVHTDTRRKIIDATLLVASRNGFDRATTSEISRTAGVSEGIIYHYFTEAELQQLLEGMEPQIESRFTRRVFRGEEYKRHRLFAVAKKQK